MKQLTNNTMGKAMKDIQVVMMEDFQINILNKADKKRVMEELIY
jgi:hypothetical protein